MWKPIVMKLDTDPEVLQQKKAALEKQLDLIENYFLKDKPFLTGEEVTIADIMCSMELNTVDFLIYDLKDEHPKLTAYLERVTQKLNPHYDDLNKVIATFASEKLGKGRK